MNTLQAELPSYYPRACDRLLRLPRSSSVRLIDRACGRRVAIAGDLGPKGPPGYVGTAGPPGYVGLDGPRGDT